MNTQIAPAELKRLIDLDAVKVVDGSWALDGTDMHALYLSDHIPGAVFFDLDAISDKSVDLPHMAPNPDTFAQAVGAMGITQHDHVVIYDRQGLFSAARVWWTFKHMGHEKVEVLRGGLPAWKTANYVTTDLISPVHSATYATKFKPEMVTSLADMRLIVDSGSRLVLDARPAARFAGSAPEPRTGLRSGHMPGSRSLPATDLVHDGALKPVSELQGLFHERGVMPGIPVTTSCGSGVTAAILSMALAELGQAAVTLYDGSWAEWGQYSLDTRVKTSV